jgi:hypothetical protein
MSLPKWRHEEELERIECGVDFGVIPGYFVRLSMQSNHGHTGCVPYVEQRTQAGDYGTFVVAELALVNNAPFWVLLVSLLNGG